MTSQNLHPLGIDRRTPSVYSQDMTNTETTNQFLTADQVAAVIAQYDSLVRQNDAVEAVASDNDGEVPWEVLDTACEMNMLPDDDRRQGMVDQLWDAAIAYQIQLGLHG